jgi:hypothetical protein
LIYPTCSCQKSREDENRFWGRTKLSFRIYH